MKNNFLKVLLITVISILIFPQVSFAAWWNPFTWFQKSPVVEPISEDTTAPSLMEVSAETVSEIPAGESSASVPTVKPAVTKWWNPASWFRKSESSSPVPEAASATTAEASAPSAVIAPSAKKETAVAKPEVSSQIRTTDQSIEIEKLKKEVEELKKSQTRIAEPSEFQKPVVLPEQTPLTEWQKQEIMDEQKRAKTAQMVQDSWNALYGNKPQPSTSNQSLPNPSTSIPESETWEEQEARDFLYADQRGWTSLTSTNAIGEKRYYRKEGTQWVRKNSEVEAQQSYYTDMVNAQLQKTIEFLEGENVKKQTEQTAQDIAKANELKSLDDQYKVLQTQIDALNAEWATLPCLSFLSGEMASRCTLLSLQTVPLANQQTAIVRKQALLEGIYLPPPIFTTPTQSTIQCFWSNGGTVWNCSSGSVGTQTKTYTQCFWSNGGTMWNCQ